MKKNKKYRLKNKWIYAINILLAQLSFMLYDSNVHNITSNFIISIIYIIIFYNFNIIYNRILKDK